MNRRIFVEGDVQGVGFRMWTQATARALGVAGWVRNRDDGRVEIHAEGSPNAVDALEAACRQGPGAARVDRVTSTDVSAENVDRFSIRPTL